MQERIYISNNKGLRLAVIMHIPDAHTEKTPAMILLHGFTGYKEEGHIESLAVELERNGILAVRFDASGYGESDGTLEHDYRLSNYISDADAVYQYLITRNDIDSSRIGLWGHSMGGIVASVFAATHPDIKLICIVSSPPLMGTTDRLAKAMQQWEETGYYERESSRFGQLRIPYIFIEDARKWNVFDYLSRLIIPKLFIWGTKDINVRPEQTKEIFMAANQPKEYVEVDGMDHFYKNNPVILSQVNTAVIQYILKNL